MNISKDVKDGKRFQVCLMGFDTNCRSILVCMGRGESNSMEQASMERCDLSSCLNACSFFLTPEISCLHSSTLFKLCFNIVIQPASTYPSNVFPSSFPAKVLDAFLISC